MKGKIKTRLVCGTHTIHFYKGGEKCLRCGKRNPKPKVSGRENVQ